MISNSIFRKILVETHQKKNLQESSTNFFDFSFSTSNGKILDEEELGSTPEPGLELTSLSFVDICPTKKELIKCSSSIFHTTCFYFIMSSSKLTFRNMSFKTRFSLFSTSFTVNVTNTSMRRINCGVV